MPIDLLQLPPFRQMRVAFGLERALFVWWTLWQELGYRVQEGGQPGRLAQADVPMFTSALAPVLPEPNKQQDALQALVSCNLLKPDGVDFYCPRFALLHGQVAANRSQAQQGGDMKAFNQRMKKAPQQAFQQSLLTPVNKLVDGNGQPLSADLVKRVMWLITACDNALFKEMRPEFTITEGLVQSALEVTQRYSDEEILAVSRKLVKHRTHPALLGMTTEKLLPMFGDVVGKLEAA